jgi:hypothetical protein
MPESNSVKSYEFPAGEKRYTKLGEMDNRTHHFPYKKD